MNPSQAQPILKGTTPTLIKNIFFKALIFFGCFIPPIVGSSISAPSGSMLNSEAVFFLVPMSICMILLPFTGILRKVIYTMPRLIPEFLLFGIRNNRSLLGISDKDNARLHSVILWSVDLIVNWVCLGTGVLILFLSLLTMNR